jgi:hypothetical protein
MSEQPPEPPSDPQDFLSDLDVPIFDLVDKGADQSGIEHRDLRPDE